jgi:signal transduction histidine kinase
MYAEMLADGQISPEQREQYGRVVDAEGARLAALVDDMLDFSALERGARVLDIEPVDVAGLARGTVDAWGPLAEREGVELELEISAGATALADATALSRILSNLLQNALKYGQPTRDGGTPRIRVEFDGMLTVCDNGPGVSTEERAVIFDRFRRGADAGNKAGAGIGLALSRELARAMNGDLMVEDDGTWTRFTLRLPPVPEEPA